MANGDSSGRRWGAFALRAALVLVAIGLLAGPLVLHFAQKRHDRLAFDIDARFPPDHPLVGGEVFATTLAEMMEHELTGGTGWRPNDFVLWGPRLWADNNANRQLGIIQALRESVRVFKDHLTKVSSDEYDANLVAADTAFRNDASASGSRRPRAATARASPGCAPTWPASAPTRRARSAMNRRNVESSASSRPGATSSATRTPTLYRSPRSPWQTDDDFYHAQGVAPRDPPSDARRRARVPATSSHQHPVLGTLFDEVAGALGAAAELKPLVVLDGGARRGLRQPPPEPRRLHHRGAPEDVLDPRGAREVRLRPRA